MGPSLHPPLDHLYVVCCIQALNRYASDLDKNSGGFPGFGGVPQKVARIKA